MDKKKIIIIAIVLLFGLGTFVFANPDDELEENNVNNSDTYLRDDNDLEDNNDSKISTNEKKVEDIDINNNNNNLQNVLSNTVFSNTNQYFNGNNQLNNSNQFPNNNGNNSNNGGNNSTGDNGNKPILPDKPDEKPDLPLVEDLSELQKLVDNLKVKVENATKREDIISAKDFRDKNKINESVLKIEDNDARYELQSILNNLNKILDDNTKPEIIGITNLEFTNKNVSLTIKEDSIKKILLNDMDIINNQDILKNISEENTYTLVVIDNSFNEEKITFTIDKTSPVTEVTTSNSGQITNSNVTVYIKANEELQNISGWKLSNDKKMLSKEFSDNTNGEQILEVRDLAGNKTEVRYEVINIKNNKPTVDEKNIVYSTKELTNGDVVVTIKVSKPVFAPEGWTPSEGYTVFTKTFTKNEKEIVLLRDVLGNTNVINIVVDNIDKDLPIANIEYSVNPNIKTNKNIDVYIKLNEKVKKPVDEAWKLSEDALSIKKTFSKNTLSEELVEIEDLAGNKVIIPIEVKNIDKNLDGIIVKTSNDDVSTNSDVTVYIISPKELNEVSGWTLSKDKKTLSKVFDKTTIGVVEVTNIDGNNYAVGYEVKNLDKVPPVVKNSDVIYEEANDGGVIVTFKVSKSIFAPDEGWQAKEGYTVFTKKYMKNVDEILCLRDIYGNTSTLHINVNISAINEINEYVQANSTIFSDLVNKIFI